MMFEYSRLSLDTKKLTKVFLRSVLEFLANFLTPQTDAVQKRSAEAL